MTYFRVAMLSSGSKGNAALISCDKQHFLIDIGISCRALTKKLKEQGLEPNQLTGVFITHEHNDHVKGLETWLKKNQVPVYTSTNTWRAIVVQYPQLERRFCRIFPGQLECGSIKVESFSVPHDAIDAHGYSFYHEDGTKCTYLTDTGFVTDEVRKAADGCQALILEANHDVEMLKKGPYPVYLKQRILSTRGHLSNDSAAHLLVDLKKLPERVFLAHLSQENNTPKLAKETVESLLAKAKKLNQTKILVADQNETVVDEVHIQVDMFSL